MSATCPTHVVLLDLTTLIVGCILKRTNIKLLPHYAAFSSLPNRLTNATVHISPRNGYSEVPIYILKAKPGYTVTKMEKDKWI
jgi:hypothetical protein